MIEIALFKVKAFAFVQFYSLFFFFSFFITIVLLKQNQPAIYESKRE